MSKFSSKKYFDLISEEALAIKKSREYKKILDILFETYKAQGVIFTMGCGGSASTATHFAADLSKTVISGTQKGFKSISLVDNIPLVSAWTNDKGWQSVFEGQLNSWITKNDVLVGFSVHGGVDHGSDIGPWSQNLVLATKIAKERGAKIIGFSGFTGGALKEMSDACLTVNSSDETYGTPLVEAMHVVLFHGIVFDLKQKIKTYGK